MLFEYLLNQQMNSVQKIATTGNKSCRCWNIITDEREVEYWKSETITFYIEFCFLVFLLCRFQCECQNKKQTFRLLGGCIILYFWIDEIQIITESKHFQRQDIIYTSEVGIEAFG